MGIDQRSGSQELVIRVVVESSSASDTPLQAGLQPDVASPAAAHIDTLSPMVAQLASTMLRLSEIVERLAVVDESDAEIIRDIATFKERLGSLEALREEVAAITERLDGIDLAALAGLAVGCTVESVEPAAEPDLQPEPTPEAEPEPELAPEPEVAPDEAAVEAPVEPAAAETNAESLVVSQLSRLFEANGLAADSAEAEAEAAALDDALDYMTENELIHSASSKAAERVLLFVLEQSGRRYLSSRDNVTRDLREILEIEDTKAISNALSRLTGAGVMQPHKKNARRIRGLEVSGLGVFDIPTVRRETWVSDRVLAKVARLDQGPNIIADASEEQPEVFDLTAEQRVIIAMLGEEATALFTENIADQLAERLGEEAIIPAEQLRELETRGLLKVMRHNGKLREYRLTPPGRVYYDQFVKEDCKPDNELLSKAMQLTQTALELAEATDASDVLKEELRAKNDSAWLAGLNIIELEDHVYWLERRAEELDRHRQFDLAGPPPSAGQS